MAQGRTKKWYISDLITVYDNTGAGAPAQFAFMVPNNLVAQPELGWQGPPATVPTALRRPRAFVPRHVLGVTSTGDRVRAIVADPTSDLWTAVDPNWTFIDNAGAVTTATRTGRVGERATA